MSTRSPGSCGSTWARRCPLSSTATTSSATTTRSSTTWSARSLEVRRPHRPRQRPRKLRKPGNPPPNPRPRPGLPDKEPRATGQAQITTPGSSDPRGPPLGALGLWPPPRNSGVTEWATDPPKPPRPEQGPDPLVSPHRQDPDHPGRPGFSQDPETL